MKRLEFELTLAEFAGEETRRAIESGSPLGVVHECARRAAHHAGEVLGPYAAPWAGSVVSVDGRLERLYDWSIEERFDWEDGTVRMLKEGIRPRSACRKWGVRP